MRGNVSVNVAVEMIDLGSINYAMITLLGMRPSGGPHPRPGPHLKDHSAGLLPRVPRLLKSVPVAGDVSGNVSSDAEAFQTRS